MWHDRNGQPPSEDRQPRQISHHELQQFIKDQYFVFLGARITEAKLNVDRILVDLDRLYPLYEYCLAESVNPTSPQPASQRQVSTAKHTKVTLAGGEIDVDLRHNLLQEALVRYLKAEFPGCRVRPELEVANSCRVDAAIDTKEGQVFCENQNCAVSPHGDAACNRSAS